MADGKSRFIPVLLNLANDKELAYSLVCDKPSLNAEFIFSFSEAAMKSNKRYNQVIIHNVMDAYQYYQANLPAFKEPTFMKWATAADIFLKKIQAVVNEEDKMFQNLNIQQINLLAFDNSKKVCLAKKPKQNKRRFNIMANDDKKIVYSQAIDVETVIEEHETIPMNWKKYALYFDYGKAILTLFMTYLFERKKITMKYPEKQKFTVWQDGKMKSIGNTDEDELLTEMFKNMGEYDFFIVKYMNRMIQELIKKRQEKNERKGKGNDQFLYDFENIVFKLHSDDTDIMFLCLYFLEFLQMKLMIPVSFLPKIIICHPSSTGSVYHVTYIYIGIRKQLEMTNKNHIQTVVRSFVMSMFSWGNDILPSPANITPETWINAYLTYTHFINNNFVILNKNPEKEKYVHNCTINGKMFKILYYLAFATKYLKDDQIDKIWGYHKQNDIDIRGLEMYINSIINAKKMLQKNKIPGNNTLKARMIISNIMLYSIEHALEIVPGSKSKALSDIELPHFCFVNIWDEYIKKVHPDHYQKAYEMRIITENTCIIFSHHVLNTSVEEEKVKHIKMLVDNAKRIFNEFHFESWRYNLHMANNEASVHY